MEVVNQEQYLYTGLSDTDLSWGDDDESDDDTDSDNSDYYYDY